MKRRQGGVWAELLSTERLPFAVPRPSTGSKATPVTALKGEPSPGSAVSKNSRTHTRPASDLGELRAVAASHTPGPHQEGKQPKLMMYDAQQSDGAILAGKAANKGARAPAEPLERRASAVRNPQRTGTVRTQSRGAVSPGAERIRQFVERKPGEKLIALLHHITP